LHREGQRNFFRKAVENAAVLQQPDPLAHPIARGRTGRPRRSSTAA
jgi:hypothetical protein